MHPPAATNTQQRPNVDSSATDNSPQQVSFCLKKKNKPTVTTVPVTETTYTVCELFW